MVRTRGGEDALCVVLCGCVMLCSLILTLPPSPPSPPPLFSLRRRMMKVAFFGGSKDGNRGALIG